MKTLTKTQSLVYGIGGLLLIAGAALPAFPELLFAAPYVYSLGAVLFCSMQMLARYDGANLTLRRLRRQQLAGAVLLLVAGGLMFMHVLGTGPFRQDEWKVVLAIGTVFELYAAFRIPAELEKKQRGNH